jgi:hypothetical protein
MADPIGAPPGSTLWAEAVVTVSTAARGLPATAGLRIPMIVAPVYFVYGGASVWTLVR